MTNGTTNQSKTVSRAAVDLLPSYFQTDKNSKFLAGTIDQLISPAKITRLDGYVGSKLTKNYNASQDQYLNQDTSLRSRYQLAPGLVVKTLEQSIAKIFSFDDLINRLAMQGGDTSNLDNILRPEFYSYAPPISWDKFVNFREYYWLASGPQSVLVTTGTGTAASVYTVANAEAGNSFVFTPDGLTPNPVITLYRGETYEFNIESPAALYISTTSKYNSETVYTTGVIGNGTSKVIFTVPSNAPRSLYYTLSTNQYANGKIAVKQQTANTPLHVDTSIVGKQYYTSGNGIEFVNGLKVRFANDVIPELYRDREYYVDGIGSAIVLIDTTNLQTPEPTVADLVTATFDGTNFDQYPFDAYKNLPIVPEYVTINRASQDNNPWSRYNRWFHKSAIEISMTANGLVPEYTVSLQATRPIVEFKPNLQLYNFGKKFLSTVTLFDTTTTDAFSMVENASQYDVDGIPLDQDYNVIFNADPDPLVRGKVFKVSLVKIDKNDTSTRISLTLLDDQPTVGSTILVLKGTTHASTTWWYDGTIWIDGQERYTRNQAPLFDLFDGTEASYSSTAITTFTGNKIFGYKVGTGTPDPVLGFALSYKNFNTGGTYEFQNYFSSDSFFVTAGSQTTTVDTDKTYFKVNDPAGTTTFLNIWTDAAPYQIPILQINEVTSASEIEITAVATPGLLTDLVTTVFFDNTKVTNFTTTSTGDSKFVVLPSPLTGVVVFKLETQSIPTDSGYYEAPLNLTNNPYNEQILDFTFSELSDHVKTMADRSPDFVGSFPGVSNLQNLQDIAKYGTRFIININPLTYAQHLLTDNDNSLTKALTFACDSYTQFKMALIRAATQLEETYTAPAALDVILTTLNQNKNSLFPYAGSDLVAYGQNYKTRTYEVTDIQNPYYYISDKFNLTTPSYKSVLVYHNGVQLLHGVEYEFDISNPFVQIIKPLVRGDSIVIREYISTDGCFIAPTPSKMGLYPKYEPSIYYDTTYANDPVKVIQGHDGSIIAAYNDYRDDILLEFEKRVYNNIKTAFDPALIDITIVQPGAYRTNKFTTSDIAKISHDEFLKWTSFYNLDFETNSTYDITNHKTYNYKSVKNLATTDIPPGHWRGIYKFYFDTDRPNTHPWEMLGFSIQPTWWQSEYGTAPYTSGNKNLWDDLELGRIAQGHDAGIHARYARPLLSESLPVDEYGNVVDVRNWGIIAENEYIVGTDQAWEFGDFGPVETVWRRSSAWPFVSQLILALCNPAKYAAVMADVGNIKKNLVGQYVYGAAGDYFSTTHLAETLTSSLVPISGHIYYVAEAGRIKASNYNEVLAQELSLSYFNLITKVGGFVSKDKLQIIIDSINPSTVNPGVMLPQEDYQLYFNNQNVVKTIDISGVMIKKVASGFVVTGYNKFSPYFTVTAPIRQTTDPALVVGGKSEPYLTWTATAFYQVGQIVKYTTAFYRVTSSHTSATFDIANFRQLAALPITGGVTVIKAVRYDTVSSSVRYGTTFNSIQEVYDFIVGYGHWLTTQGFVFNEYNTDLSQVVDWNFSSKEFLYWTTQNWSDGSVISISPFANTLEVNTPDYVVNSLVDITQEYSVHRVDGTPFPAANLSVLRGEGTCKVTTTNTQDGIFFARLLLLQKEHVIILNNSSIFSDVIYDVRTGYKQERIRLVGFKTSDWNGEYFSPGFIYDDAVITNWTSYSDYIAGDIVKYAGKYYSANLTIAGTETFNFEDWNYLSTKPVAQLLPNFDYKINQFEDFYSLEIDNIDVNQQKLAQHLIGYTPRPYLDNIFVNPTSQYKFYQGFIKEKGTKNAIDKLTKATLHNLNGSIEFSEEWAFRVGAYGGYSTFKEMEFPLRASEFKENSQIVEFTQYKPATNPSNYVYITPVDLDILPDNFNPSHVFETTADDSIFTLPVAGYVRLDDVTTTAFTTADILTITDTASVMEGNTIWVANNPDGEWDVYRYTSIPPKLIAGIIGESGVSILFTTDISHQLAVGDIVSVSRLDDQLNGVYTVASIPALNQFTVASTLTTVEIFVATGELFKMISVRFDKFDDLTSYEYLIDIKYNEMVWTDADDTGKWAVYEKIDNFYPAYISHGSTTSDNQQFGYTLASRDSTSTFITAAPAYDGVYSYGRVYVKEHAEDSFVGLLNYGINTSTNYYYDGGSETGFGSAISYDSAYDLIYAGAPLTGNIKADTSGTTRFAKFANSIVSSTGTGLVKISGIDHSFNPAQEIEYAVLVSQAPQNNAFFGSSVFINQQSNKKLLVGAPGQNTGTGAVFVYDIDNTPSNYTVTATQVLSTSSIISGSNFGAAIAGSDTGEVIAISAPGTSQVIIYKLITSTYQYAQTISINDEVLTDIFTPHSKFANAISISGNGEFLFITAPKSGTGKVVVYKWNGTAFLISQLLTSPTSATELIFGQAISSNYDATELAITSLGDNKHPNITFDNSETTFDSEACTFSTIIKNSGAAYTYSRHGTQFIFARELYDINMTAGSHFGTSILVANGYVVVGAPSNTRLTVATGAIFTFDKIDATLDTWSAARLQDDLVDIAKIKRVLTLDSTTEQTIEYIDLIDPAKGRIAGLADQEIKFKTAFDPAIYNVGEITTVTIDTEISWSNDHTGQVWWDLSTMKYMWYEQGELSYRKFYWGALFPGSTVDIYEWVKTEYLPSQWADLADTTEGIALGISGQPKYPDDSVMSVGQTYNSVAGVFTNIYYYWVKNSAIVPDERSRRNSTYAIAQLIQNPTLQGIANIAVLSESAMLLTNLTSSLNDDNIKLNVNYDELNSSVNKHTEWVLLSESASRSQLTPMLEKKLFDSLLGRDTLGNLVPDPTLPDKMKYGIDIRPRQSMFKQRRAALRDVISYSNIVLSKYITDGFIDFTLLNSQDTAAPAIDGTYDLVLADDSELPYVNLQTVTPAILTAVTTSSGKISSVIITDSGSGYGKLYALSDDTWVGPTVTVAGDNTSLQIKTVVDVDGKITAINIIDPGVGYVEAPQLIVRPYTVLVTSDSTSGNKWANYIRYNNAWIKIQVQTFNTPLYWNYVDWSDANFNSAQAPAAIVDYVYDLASITLSAGAYVKVVNGGNGYYIILQKTSGIAGTFSPDYNIVYQEHGTIVLSDALWDTVDSQLGFDQNVPFDQTLYDQMPDIELENILTALKTSVFVGNLAQYWNKLFFAAVRYALTEQTGLDWAFKTSFISATHLAGSLDQRAVYKFQNSQYYEDYLNEVKPYHTKVRNFITNYANLEQAYTQTTDFDLPAIYNSEKSAFESVTLDSDVINEYPYLNWKNNYTYHVSDIRIADAGSGYTTVPVIKIVSAAGDTVTTPATAEAYISLGKLTSIIVTNPGDGYTKTPTVIIQGGGSTTLTPARLYAVLSNNKVRSNLIGMRFDRTSSTKQIGDKTAIDNFITDGFVTVFELVWAAGTDKSVMSVYVNGIKLLPDQFDIENFTAPYLDLNQVGTPYTKHYTQVRITDGVLTEADVTINADTVSATPVNADVIYLNNVTNIEVGQAISFNNVSVNGTVVTSVINTDNIKAVTISPITVTAITNGTRLKFISTATASTIDIHYIKSLDIYNAADRILDYYNPTSGMPGVELGQLMTGVDYPGIEFQTLPFNESANWDNLPFGSVFWEDSENTAKLDTVLDGGDLAYSTALGVNPEDVTMDGDKFISAYSSHAPEELVPGEIKESLGINVYTRIFAGSPVILHSIYPLAANIEGNFVLRTTPVNIGAITVSFNGTILNYNIDYYLNFENKTITIPAQPDTGIVYVSIIGAGGEQYLDTNTVTVPATASSATVQSLAITADIGSAYVTVNGVKITTSTAVSPYYVIAPASATNKRGSAKVYGLSNLSADTNTITAWFFQSASQQVSEIYEQLVVYSGTQRTWVLDHPPGNLGSQSSQVIVELNDKRLVPPNTTYYNAAAQQISFDIDPNNNYVGSIFDLSTIDVYVNGIKIKDGIDFRLNEYADKILFNAGFLTTGDEVAITIIIDYDYYIMRNGQLFIHPRIPLSQGDLLKIITFTNHDQLYMRQEVFDANEAGFYQLSRQVIDDNYVWASLNRNILANKFDFYIDSNLRTLRTGASVPYVAGTQLVVTSFSEIAADTTIGYRMFKDMLNRTHFKRLSAAKSTYLVSPLYVESTEILVNDAAVLPDANPTMGVPGIILIDGERIEYMAKAGNSLTRLTRATLGTGAKAVYNVGTTVIDQGASQTVPFTESVLAQNFTATNTTTYTITDISFASIVNSHDQVAVYCGGVLLRKPTPTTVLHLVHDTTKSYDSGQYNSDITQLPEYEITTSTGVLRLASMPALGKTITVVQHLSSIWYEQGVTTPSNGVQLLYANTVQAQFLRDQTSTLPDKYYYGQT